MDTADLNRTRSSSSFTRGKIPPEVLKHAKAALDFASEVPDRHNSLADIDFNIIADTIRCQNLRNQMNMRLISLKHSLSNSMQSL